MLWLGTSGKHGAPEAGVLATLKEGAQDDAGPLEDGARGLGGAQAGCQ